MAFAISRIRDTFSEIGLCFERKKIVLFVTHGIFLSLQFPSPSIPNIERTII